MIEEINKLEEHWDEPQWVKLLSQPEVEEWVEETPPKIRGLLFFHADVDVEYLRIKHADLFGRLSQQGIEVLFDDVKVEYCPLG